MKGRNRRELKRLHGHVTETHKFEAAFADQSNAAFRAQTESWQRELAAIEDPKRQRKKLDELLPRAFALVRTAADRLRGKTADVCEMPTTWDMKHYDVQLLAGAALHERCVAEMATGEGKTLAATLPTYLNALAGKGAHVVTANDYLAKRDSQWMGMLFGFLGLSVGCLQTGLAHDARRDAYEKDITFGTAAEFGFDYLRDNSMAMSPEHRVQRGHYFALIDEIDYILIDEARVPLIITQPREDESPMLYASLRPLIEKVVRAQRRQCQQLLKQARQAMEARDTQAAGRALFQVEQAQPRDPGLLKMKENPEALRLMEHAELALHQDMQKIDIFNLREELFFTVDPKSRQASLTEKGRQLLSPNDPDQFTIPDPDDPNFGVRAGHMHAVSQLLGAYSLYIRDTDYLVKDGNVIIIDRATERPMEGRRWSDGLHQAVEAKERVDVQRETETLASVTIQNYFRLYPNLAGMTGTAMSAAEEFEEIYGLRVRQIPTHRPCLRNDLDDRVFRTIHQKNKAIAAEIESAHARKQPVLVGTASVSASEQLSKLLKRKKVPHTVLNARNHEREAEIIRQAGMPGAVTISTNMAGRGTDIKLGDGVADLGGLYVIGTERQASMRIDRQLRGRSARQGDPGQSCFFLSLEDELIQRFGAKDRLAKVLELGGVENGEPLTHSILTKAIERAQKQMEHSQFEARKHTLRFDDVVNVQRLRIYERRDNFLASPDSRSALFELLDEIEELPKEFGSMSALRGWYQNQVPEEIDRQLLLSVLDHAWREHLTNLDDLR
ncbi:MAG: preprotein translocase subunit SecA, partial [Pseudomonadota bacterium]